MQIAQSRYIHFIEKLGNLLKSVKVHPRSNLESSAERAPARLKSGDMVSVRSLEEIKSTLDKDGRYDGGIVFIDEMAQYCGKTYRVLKRINKIFDSDEWCMKMSHEIVILEGVFCHGYGPHEECDRTCPFFWKDAWLEKVKC
jgi:hypothetical protein